MYPNYYSSDELAINGTKAHSLTSSTVVSIEKVGLSIDRTMVMGQDEQKHFSKEINRRRDL